MSRIISVYGNYNARAHETVMIFFDTRADDIYIYARKNPVQKANRKINIFVVAVVVCRTRMSSSELLSLTATTRSCSRRGVVSIRFFFIVVKYQRKNRKNKKV